jgi:hypothetical protein
MPQTINSGCAKCPRCDAEVDLTGEGDGCDMAEWDGHAADVTCECGETVTVVANVEFTVTVE